MKHLEISGGRALNVRIEGTPGTVKDYMVAAHVYLVRLEEQFNTPLRLIAAYRAAEKELEAGRSKLTAREIDLSSRWLHAHESADHIARTLLSDPLNQRFVLTPLVEDTRDSNGVDRSPSRAHGKGTRS